MGVVTAGERGPRAHDRRRNTRRSTEPKDHLYKGVPLPEHRDVDYKILQNQGRLIETPGKCCRKIRRELSPGQSLYLVIFESPRIEVVHDISSFPERWSKIRELKPSQYKVYVY